MKFRYRALDFSGKVNKGVMDAEDYEELWKTLRKANLYLIHYCKQGNKKISFKGKPNYRDLSMFCKEFYLALKSGINVEQVVQILLLKWSHSTMKYCLFQLNRDIQRGKSISSSMNKFQYLFPTFMVSMIRIGEESGKLEEVFESLSKYYYREYKYKNKLINTMIYPAIVLITTCIVTYFLLLKIIPIFINSFSMNQYDIPLITKIIIKLSNFTVKYNIVIITLMVLLLFVVYLISKSKIGNDFFSSLKLKMPITKKIEKYSVVYRISSELNLLLLSGMNLLKSIELICESIENNFIKKKMIECLNSIKTGHSISESFKNTNLYEPYISSMIKVGEETGKLDTIFNTIADIHEDLMDNLLKRIAVLMEPIMLIIISIIVGTIIISFILPVFNMMNQII